MKPGILLALSLLIFGTGLKAQKTFSTSENIDIANIKAAHMVHGDMWLKVSPYLPACEFPKGAGKHVAYLGALWIGGYDTSGNLKLAAQEYRQQGNDYWPGPIDTNISTPALKDSLTKKWARIWKVNRSSIDFFRSISSHDLVNTPSVILEWPAKGNIYAVGANGASLTINRDMAPFVDVDSDGVYNALQGDYPMIKGDQMLWWIINDYYYPHANSKGLAMGLEIKNSAYAYKRNGSIDNVIFYEYQITNQGGQLNNWRFGLAQDMDLGYGLDDYMGFDSSRRMGFVYNAKNPDGNGEPSSYGTDIPTAGISILEMPGDSYPTLTPAGSFIVYNNSQTSVMGNPSDSLQYYYYLNTKNRTGVPIVPGRYMHPGTYMCNNGFPNNIDTRGLLATDSYTFIHGETKKIALALIVAPNAGACPSTDLTGLNHTADTALTVYYNPLPPTPTGIITPASAKTLHIYPNPAKNILHIKPSKNTDGKVIVFDAMGRNIAVEKTVNAQIIDINISSLIPGIYTVVYKDKDGTSNNIFIKE